MSGSTLKLLEPTWDATVEVFFPYVWRRLVALSYKWFSQYVATYTSNIHDCHVVEYSPDAYVMVVLASCLSDEHAYLNSLSLGMNVRDVVQP